MITTCWMSATAYPKYLKLPSTSGSHLCHPRICHVMVEKWPNTDVYPINLWNQGFLFNEYIYLYCITSSGVVTSD